MQFLKTSVLLAVVAIGMVNGLEGEMGYDADCSCYTVTETAPLETYTPVAPPGLPTETTPTSGVSTVVPSVVPANIPSTNGGVTTPIIGSDTLIIPVSSPSTIVEVSGGSTHNTGTTTATATAPGTDITTAPTDSGASGSVISTPTAVTTSTETSVTSTESQTSTTTTTESSSSTSSEPSSSEAPPTSTEEEAGCLPTGSVNMGALLGGAALVAIANANI